MVKLTVIGLVLLAAVFGVANWMVTSNQARSDDGERAFSSPRLVAVDSSGNGHDGVIQGQPHIGLPGHKGRSYSFDRPTSWVQVPPSPLLNPADHDFIFTAWVNFTVAPTARHTFDILRKGLSYTPTGEYKLEIVPGGFVRCSAKDSDGHDARVTDATTVVTDAAWHRIGCARIGSTWNVIVDKTVTTDAGPALGSITNALAISIGSKYGREDLPDGRIDEVALIIGERRAADAVPNVTKALKALRALEPAGLWHLDEAPR